MKKHSALLSLSLVTLSLTVTQSRAQSIYTPYAFTKLVGSYGTNDGTISTAQFQAPEGVAVDVAGNLYVADRGNHTIRMMTPDGVVTTLAGMPRQNGTNDGVGSAARFSSPTGVAVDGAGNVYVADSGNNTVRKVTPAGVVTTLAGRADGHSGSSDGVGSAARFLRPYGVAVDGATNLYVADNFNNMVRKMTQVGTNWIVSTIPNRTTLFDEPQGLVLDSATNLYVTQWGNHVIRKITPSGVVTTIAGAAGQPGTNDGVGTAARFSGPNGLAVDGAGNLYVVDQNNQTTRRITPAGVVTTLGGTAGAPGRHDGIGATARFSWPSGLALDSAGSLIIGDMENSRIVKGIPAFLFDKSPGSSTVSNGLFAARLLWPFVTDVVIEASADLQGWTPIQTNAHPSGSLEVFVPLDTNQYQFFRAHLTP